MSSTFEDTNDIVLLEHCFDEFGMVQEFNLCGNIIKVQPADDVPHACDRIWQGLEPITKLERSKIGPSASLDDIFPNLAAAYRPQLFHYYVHDDGRAAVAWRVPFVAGELNNLKSLMVALMMWNGIADSRHVWQMLGHGVGLDELDVFLWGYVTDDGTFVCFPKGFFFSLFAFSLGSLFTGSPLSKCYGNFEFGRLCLVALLITSPRERKY